MLWTQLILTKSKSSLQKFIFSKKHVLYEQDLRCAQRSHANILYKINLNCNKWLSWIHMLWVILRIVLLNLCSCTTTTCGMIYCVFRQLSQSKNLLLSVVTMLDCLHVSPIRSLKKAVKRISSDFTKHQNTKLELLQS